MYTVASTSQLCHTLRLTTLHTCTRSFKRVKPPPGCVRHLQWLYIMYSKPPILPPAKTKRYSVQQPRAQPADEVKELLWRRTAYTDAMNAIRKNLAQMLSKEAELGDELSQQRKLEAREFKRLLRENEEKNAVVLKTRTTNEEASVARQHDETMRNVQTYVDEQAAMGAQRTAEVQRLIVSRVKTLVDHTMQTESAYWITPDNLLAKIDEALENPRTFDYAINKRGAIIETPVAAKYVDRTPAHPQSRMYETSYILQKDDDVDDVFEEVEAGKTSDTVS